jgi:hypothetical protein
MQWGGCLKHKFGHGPLNMWGHVHGEASPTMPWHMGHMHPYMYTRVRDMKRFNGPIMGPHWTPKPSFKRNTRGPWYTTTTFQVTYCIPHPPFGIVVGE